MFLIATFYRRITQVTKKLYQSISQMEMLKYTAPKEGTLQSVILEKMTYDSKTKEYMSTYVLSVKHDDKPSNVRLTFKVKVKATDSKKKVSVVTTEPKESNYNK